MLQEWGLALNRSGCFCPKFADAFVRGGRCLYLLSSLRDYHRAAGAYEFYEADRRNVSKTGVNEVMRVPFASCQIDQVVQEPSPEPKYAAQLSVRLRKAKCEEEAAAL
jgi:hypothetical protein